jgi:predicted nicotinamide N-methyase
VLELGAGTGAVSLCLLAARAAEGAVMTDLPDVLPHLRRNVAHNAGAVGPGAALVAPLRWGDARDGGRGCGLSLAGGHADAVGRARGA